MDASSLREEQVTYYGDVSTVSLSPDGQCIAYSRGQSELWFRDLTTGREIHALDAARLFAPCWSPDGTRLLVWGYAEAGAWPATTWVLDRMSSDHALVGPVGFAGVAWSANSHRIAGTVRGSDSDGTRICILDVSTGDTAMVSARFPLSGPEGRSYRPLETTVLGWSPTAPVLLARIRLGGASRSYVIPVAGGPATELDAAQALFWSPSGDRVYVKGPEQNLCAIPVDRSTGLPRGALRSVLDRFVATTSTESRDGTRLAYVQRLALGRIFAAELPDSFPGEPNWTPITEGTRAARDPSFSPDGREIAFIRESGQASQVWTIPFQGGKPRRVSDDDEPKSSPVWSPDGTRIAYKSAEGIAILDLATGRQKRLPGSETVRSLYWNPWPDLVYQNDRTGLRGYVERKNEDEKIETRLPIDPARGTIFQIARSPDGNRIAAAGNRGTDPVVKTWLISMQDGQERLVYDGWAGPVRWSPDGEWIYLISETEAGDHRVGRLFRVRVSDGEVEEVALLPGKQWSWRGVDISSDGRRIACEVDEELTDVWILDGLAL